MPLWPVNLRSWQGANFGQIVPERILIEYDGLITFTFRDTSDNLMLAHFCDEDEDKSRYIVAPTSEREIERLIKGTISLRGALEQQIIWVVDVKNSTIITSWSGLLSQLPQNVIPNDDVMLHPNLKPLIKLKASSSAMRPGAVAAEAIRGLIEGAEGAMSTLLKHIAPGREDGFQLEAQQLAFNSIEIAFQPTPKHDRQLFLSESDDVLPRVEEMLTAGLAWLSSEGEHPLPPNDEKAILAAVRQLAPKQGGPISTIEVSGRAVGVGLPNLNLNNDTRRRLNAKIRPSRVVTVDKTGRIREYDADAHTFQLRDIVGEVELQLTFIFSPDQRDDVYRHLDKTTLVKVSGELEANKYKLIDLVSIPETRGS